MAKPKQENNRAMILSLKILAKLVVIAPTKPLTCDGQHRENHPMKYRQKPVKDNLNLRDGRLSRMMEIRNHTRYINGVTVLI
jgi:hypothetical protein